ncbi:hypothetical protein GCM10020331_066860 [Ectobacillus funiculus]
MMNNGHRFPGIIFKIALRVRSVIVVDKHCLASTTEKAVDIIICSQDFYMEHVWTYEARKREGQLPLLPEGSCVVFDEGHLVEYAAQKGAYISIEAKYDGGIAL